MMLPKNYRFPAEWEKHEATWLTWPYLEDSFPGKLKAIYPKFVQFIKEIANGEIVRIIVPDEMEMGNLIMYLMEADIDSSSVEMYIHPTNDVWCRDHGPAFLINPKGKDKKIIVNWEFNAWGNKYPSELDNLVPQKIAQQIGYPVYSPGIIMEGGAIDVNGKGTLMTTTSCLLNSNRNPQFSQEEIEQFLCNYYGVQQILWLGEGIEGDDTDGHIDDIARFVNEDTVVTVVEDNEFDNNFLPLQENLLKLKSFRLLNGKPLKIVELPMPVPQYWESKRLPASYANFYICNAAVIVPQFQCIQDELALEILGELFKDRKVIGIDSKDIIWGLGSFHCLSQQEPYVE